MENQKEYILCSAIWVKDGNKGYVHQPSNIESGYVVTGRRHHNCYTLLFMLRGVNENLKREEIEEGFLTSTDKFVSREEAGKIALLASQLEDERHATLLHSEYLY